jgi:hypothetical protein
MQVDCTAVCRRSGWKGGLENTLTTTNVPLFIVDERLVLLCCYSWRLLLEGFWFPNTDGADSRFWQQHYIVLYFLRLWFPPFSH